MFANEVVPVYASTYAQNHIGAKVLTDDIRSLDADSIRDELGLAKGELSLLAGGPPCQGFSINAPVRSNEDHRNHLFKDYSPFCFRFYA